MQIDSRECRNRHLGPERLDQGTIGRPIGSARRRRQITVGKEGLDGGKGSVAEKGEMTR